MKTGYGFTEFENLNEFKDWLFKQKVTRKVTRLQVHHTYAPSYKHWATDNALRRQNSMKSFHMKTNGWGDIAQHFTIFPDGHIVTGRSLNSTPIGIKGWNTNAICVEIYGDFDNDNMNDVQKKAIVGCYRIMADKFGIAININNIRPHAFFTASGTYLGKYVAGKSAKTCPGKKFFGGLDKFESVFLAEVKKFTMEGYVPPKTPVGGSDVVDYNKLGKYIGDKNAIKVVQEQLKKLGYYKDSVDGLYGPNMYKAVTEFQKANKLDVDGYVGPKTKEALRKTTSN